jgi:serine/threonine-protein kinase
MQPIDEIDGYRLEAKLGEGGMGEVWRARPLDQKIPVAIKLLLPEYTANRDLVARFLREANLELDHPNIVPVQKLVNIEGRPGFVMPLYTGGSLEQRVRPDGPNNPGKPLPFTDVFSISRDVLRGLNHAHISGFIHCDVKPSNILFDAGGRAYLTDFGVALEMVRIDLTMRGVIGTPEYMSPEQITRGARAVKGESITHLTDVYSFGCCLYEMLTGRPPFNVAETGGSAFAVQEKHVREAPPNPSRWNPRIPPSLDRVVLESLAKDPKDRIAGCQEFAARLDAVEEEIRRKDYNDGSDARGRRILIAATAFATVVVTLPSVYWLMRPKPSMPASQTSTLSSPMVEPKPARPESEPSAPEPKPAVPAKPLAAGATLAAPELKPAVPKPKPVKPDTKPAGPNPKPAVEQKPPMPEPPPPLPALKPPVAESNPSIRDQKPLVPEPEAPLPKSKPPLAESKPPVPDQKPLVPEAKPPRPNLPPPTPAAGILVWRGHLAKNTPVEITSSGTLQGSLPGVPVYIVALQPSDLEIVEPPSPSNGFRRLVVRSRSGKTKEVRISWQKVRP